MEAPIDSAHGKKPLASRGSISKEKCPLDENFFDGRLEIHTFAFMTININAISSSIKVASSFLEMHTIAFLKTPDLPIRKHT
jgi:hypothetical protein